MTLIETLRSDLSELGVTRLAEVARDAADEIEEMQAEISKLRLELKNKKSEADG